MTLYLEWEANHRHAEAQRIASEHHRYGGSVHDSNGLLAALKKLFSAKGTATVVTPDIVATAPVNMTDAVNQLNKKYDSKHRKVS